MTILPTRSLSSLILVLIPLGVLAAEKDRERPVYAAPESRGQFADVDLDKLTERLIRTLKEMHVETDRDDPQFGMIYESFDPQRRLWVEGEGRDTMHHMMWTMVGLANAYRATGNEAALDFLKEYPYPFYLRMMLHGEKHFGPEYGNGFCPYYWDDGDSFDLPDYLHGMVGPETAITGHSPMSSIHMAQDLSLGHLDLWWLTRDPRLKQATADLYHQVHYGKIAERFAARDYAIRELNTHPARDLEDFRDAQEKAKDVLRAMPEQERRALYEKRFGPQYGPIVTAAHKCLNEVDSLPMLGHPRSEPTDNIAWLRLRERKSGGLPSFPDEESFDYYLAISDCGSPDGVDERYARWFTMQIYNRLLMNEYWMDDARYPHGFGHFPGAGQFWQMKDGRFVTYRSDAPWHFWHTRSIHFAWLAGIALQMMEEWPDAHEHYQNEIAPDEPTVRFTDQTPTLDGKRDGTYQTVFNSPGPVVALASDPLSLFVHVAGRNADSLSLTVHSTEEQSKKFAVIQRDENGEVKVFNSENEPLHFWSKASPEGLEIQIPYMIHPQQKDWLTAVEHGRHLARLSIGTQDKPREQIVYFLSSPERLKRRLRETVEGTIVNHAAMLDERGWLTYAPADKSRHQFTNLSFSGGYGHLIHVIAQYQIWKQGQRDWKLKESVRVNLSGDGE
ncbi:hypothetical protein [Lignipirellula cremea]|uniref:Uncharacterized protein n=1 Tax=Lignipirellula cremea TaxID=2528010 RepID=A0A518E2L0_9BACT|nr:hypothetical protein [Lignipirellula cremea]QDU98302.1 hypothetical protein Pla8534_61640 [Lignipirellula cremea]